MSWITIVFATDKQVTIEADSVDLEIAVNGRISMLNAFDAKGEQVGKFTDVQAYWVVSEPEQPHTELRVN